MWGGWYDDPEYMNLMKKMRTICGEGMDTPDAEVAAFIDEKSIPKSMQGAKVACAAMRALGLSGAPCDIYLASDFNEVFDKYKACIFIEPAETELCGESVKKAEAAGKYVKRITAEAPVVEAELYEWLKGTCVDIPVSRCAVVYRGKKYVMLYTHEDGEYDFEDRGKKSFVDLFTGEKVTFPRQIPKAKCFLFERG